TRRRSRSSPRSNSRRASRPTTKKNSVISPELTQYRTGSEMPCDPTLTVSVASQIRSYVPSSTLTHTSATTVAASSTTALPVSVRRNVRRGVSRFRAHAVRPVKLCARELTSRFFLLAHWRGAEEGAPGTAAGRAARHSGPGGLLGGRRGRGPDAAAAEYDGRRPSVERSPECERQRWDLPAL